MRARTVIISGGGTGGHLYPALTVGAKLKEREPGLHLIYVGSRRGVEKTIMDGRGIPFVALPVEGIKGRGFRMLHSLLLLPWSLVRSASLLLGVGPGLVIGMGGYSSGPVCLTASLFRVPTLILEQNAVPGFTNRLLLPFVTKAVASFPDSLPYFRGKGIVLGNPVREEFYGLRAKARSDVFTLFVFGGSQGSHILNEAVLRMIPLLLEDKARIEIFHQTGSADLERVQDGYARAGFRQAVVAPFFENMAELFEQSDLCLCRAGATTIAELVAARRAAILVPFAAAADNHQLRNARELERLGGAEVLTEEELSAERLAERIRTFLDDRDKAASLAARLEPLRTEGAAENIVTLCLEMMAGRARRRGAVHG